MFDAFRAYQNDIALARETYGYDREFTSYDVQNMDLATYDRYFDEAGQTARGLLVPTDRPGCPSRQPGHGPSFRRRKI